MFLFCSCQKGGSELNIKLSPIDKSYRELITVTYSDKQLEEITSFDGSIEVLNAEYPIECIRNTESGYRVSYCGEDHIAIIIFDHSFKKIMSNIYNFSVSKSSFEHLTQKQTLDDVREIDPNGNYFFYIQGDMMFQENLFTIRKMDL